MRYFITGVPGSGKTTIGKLLQNKGYEFLDSDHVDGLANWYNGKTREIVQPNPGKDAQWYKHHSWDWNREKLELLLKSYREKNVFLCGITSNQTKDLDLFDKVFLLTTNPNNLRTRMINRREGGDIESIDTVFEWHEQFEREMIKHRAILIDSSQEPSDIVTEILSHVD